ncbi:hypothetical protein ACFPJ4_12385 [Lysinimonas soli]|uniref:Uncharacterized protein n=1 Tax=Lysinimonas soli TaxID=1074233 RepID=A0ABW0NTF2_9MICO
MTDPRPFRAAPRAALVALLVGLLGALVLGPAPAASASLGSVPAEVAGYVADGGMVARLNDVYGKNASGTAGIDFDATTKAGAISRVYEWTALRLTGAKTDHPVQLTNNWVVPITIGDKPVGLATIWINPQTVEPELAQFSPKPALATAMSQVPAAAALVRDTATGAWLALADGVVTPLVAGSSGLTTPAPVDSLRLVAGATPVPVQGDPNTGLLLAIGLVAAIVVIILSALVVQSRRQRRIAVGSAGAGGGQQAAPAPPEPVVTPASTVEPARAPSPAAAPVPSPGAHSPRSTPGSRATPVTKPATSKPPASRSAGRTATTAAASGKPPVQKPPVQKPLVQKPPTQKPAARKPKPAQESPAQPSAESSASTQPKPGAKPRQTPRVGPKPDTTPPIAPGSTSAGDTAPEATTED